MEQMAAQTLAGLSVRTVKSVRQQVSSLSGGQRQTVAIAKAVLWNSKLVILDEPTAALGVAQTAQVLELVRRLADNGLAVVLISHNMNDVFAVSDRIAALYLGRMVAQVKTTDVTHAQVVELITAGRSGELGLPGSAGWPTRRPRRQPDDDTTRRHDANGWTPHDHRAYPRRDPRRRRRRTSRSAPCAAPTSSGCAAATWAPCRPCSACSCCARAFAILRPVFLTAGNFANLLPQGAAVTVIAMGLVFVLLLGEIDLSAGFTSGVCAAVLAIVLAGLRPALVRRGAGRDRHRAA